MSISLLKTAAKHVVGVKQTTRALQKNLAAQVFIAADADPHITQPLVAACTKQNVLCEEVESMQSLGKACGIHAGAAAAAILKA